MNLFLSGFIKFADDDIRRRVDVFLYNKDGKILVGKTHENGKTIYTPPGGGIDEGESFSEAAHREALEEIGISSQNFENINDLYNIRKPLFFSDKHRKDSETTFMFGKADIKDNSLFNREGDGMKSKYWISPNTLKQYYGKMISSDPHYSDLYKQRIEALNKITKG